jgi:hypothetical protein
MNDNDRYWTSLKCEVCNKHIGWSRWAAKVQCTDCNELPLDWDLNKGWLKRYDDL